MMARIVATGWASKLILLLLVVGVGLGCEGEQGPPGPPGPQGEQGEGAEFDPSTAVEGCIGCHAVGFVAPAGAVPVGNIRDLADPHFTDLDADGPWTPSGYRQLNVIVTQVDVTGTSVVIDFSVEDENGAAVTDVFAADGRFVVARLDLPSNAGDPTAWTRLLSTERFTTAGGSFQALGGGDYRYTSNWDPTSIPIADGDTIRVAVQVSARDLPPGNGWCDFDADLASANDDCDSASETRDIVQTDTCNGCHGVTSDTQLTFHGARTEVEYCVTCHNPDLSDAERGSADMTVMIHKIHFGSGLANGYRDYSHVNFTKDIDDCTTCHTGGGDDVQNWATEPNRDSCGSCHDGVNFDTGEGHGQGGVQQDNSLCANCHPPLVDTTGSQLPVAVVHQGVARSDEGELYQSPNGFILTSVVWDQPADKLTILYSVVRDGRSMLLESDPEWTAPRGASRLAITVGWPTIDYTNEDSGSAPAQPVSYDALDVGNTVTSPALGEYQLEIDVPSGAFGTVTVGMEGHPAGDLDGDGLFTDRIAVRNAYRHANVDPRGIEIPRSDVIDIEKCNLCHDSAGAGISLHGNNRTSEMQVCVVCHNANATDIRRRPEDPDDSLDGKKEEAVDIKRMIHQIHAGKSLDQGVVIYGFGNTAHDFSHVDFIGNLANCETCHYPTTYATDDVYGRLPTTIDTGEDREDPNDDLNISTVASLCSSCHDDAAARDHMLLNGASFHALDMDIH